MPARPVLLTVDDDRAVSRAVARDLRRHYGDRYRIVRAESGRDALAVLRELTARGEATALLLADHRMPGMTGVEFLEQAMDLAPTAKRVLLTAYADTDAAIRAINDVDLDHYLLKPWDPPEELLYPVLDELLEDWTRTARAPFEGITLLGHQWSAETQQLKEFLARNQVPYRHLQGEDAAGIRTAADLADDATLPALLFPEGTVLRRPTLQQVAQQVGLATTAGSPFYDVVVVGGGPAGLGAAVYAASEGLRTLLVERTATGGQAGQSSRIENYLGFPLGVSGSELAQRARDQAVRFGVELLTAAEVVQIAPKGDGRALLFADGSQVAAHAVVLATGVSWRLLPAEGAADLTGRGVYYGAVAHQAADCAGEEVFVVGAANSAGQAALHFARFASKVVVLCRGTDIRQSMSEYLVARIEADPLIEVRTCTQVQSVEGADHLERLVLADSRTGATEVVPASRLFVFIGASPPTEWLGEAFLRDERGFLRTGPALLDEAGRPPRDWPLTRAPYHLECSVPGVFVAGDVRAESVKRVASAVGEGAMAVTLVHRYLEAN
ncbi:FAD-dependent oxidoreductase [Modestobacter sp. VKM Ac-2979]|uniref:FAD-dependent oxidoreductase n=1 Tax=unclassified Modestobacter TaxID=2643866 RepID=UPI0022AB811C|nr:MULTISPECIES: FAD-dependent oxidoreductase [unclassified Modestobacter]MCZ2814216.1 FAD-dependent oxidoreductase [Modestobacter sp. VKM Ac-2979]MCZ2844092.1 FAD-dependent oxidoreductase [Modestobacter sp. VKM Ac-2980]